MIGAVSAVWQEGEEAVRLERLRHANITTTAIYLRTLPDTNEIASDRSAE